MDSVSKEFILSHNERALPELKNGLILLKDT